MLPVNPDMDNVVLLPVQIDAGVATAVPATDGGLTVTTVVASALPHVLFMVTE